MKKAGRARSKGYVVLDVVGEASQKAAALPPPMGMGLDDARIHRLVVTASYVDDPGEDWCLFTAFDRDGKELSQKKLRGY